mmetsp:Transcript_31504/g.91106  ORF Transcript_31504/g.91106 Transcript_31504/m.91106 type:complete len:254 (-) Transcript_31504:562-1323(-)
MVPADQCPEHAWRDQQLRVVLVVALLPWWAIATAGEATHDLGDLRDDILRRLCRSGSPDLHVAVSIALPGLRERHQQLHGRVQVARVTEVLQTDEPRTSQPDQVLAGFADPTEVITQVEIDLHLRQGLVGLLHLHGVDAPMLQVLRQERILDHVVLVRRIGVDVRALGSDRAELDDQRVEITFGLLLLEVVHGSVAPTRTVEELSTSTDEAIRQIEPQVLRVPADRALPILRIRADFLVGRDLNQVFEVLGLF